MFAFGGVQRAAALLELDKILQIRSIKQSAAVLVELEEHTFDALDVMTAMRCAQRF